MPEHGSVPADLPPRRNEEGWVDEGLGMALNLLAKAEADARGKGLARRRRPWRLGSEGPGELEAGLNEVLGREKRGGDGEEYELPVEPDGSSPAELRAMERGSAYLRWRIGRNGMASGGSGPRRSDRDPRRLSSLLSAMDRDPVWARETAMARLAAEWGEIVGADVAAHCSIESFTDGKLVLRCTSTAWAKQMQMLLPQVEKAIAEKVGEGAVTQVIVRPPSAPKWNTGRYSMRDARGPRDTYG